MPSGVAWILQMLLLPGFPQPSGTTEAISLQSALEVYPKSKTEIPLYKELTTYRPPGTIKYSAACQCQSTSVGSGSAIVLVVRGRSIASRSLMRCCFSNAPQSSIHLRGAIAAFSSSKSLISDMGKLGRKRVLSRHTRWSAATQTTRCRVVGWRALHVLIILHWFEQWKFPMSRHTLRSAKISDGWRNMQIPICTSKQMFASVSATTSAIASENSSSHEC